MAKEYLNNLKKFQHGTCLSLFLPAGQLEKRIRDLEICYFESLSLLRKAMSAEELKQFLRPLKDLIRNPDTTVKFKADLAIYRSHQFFKIISLPIAVDRSAVVASSFHIKPLLRWSQLDMEYFMLGINEVGISLYRGDLNNLTEVASYSRKRAQAESDLLGGSLVGHWSLWTSRLLRGHDFPLFILGAIDEVFLFQKKLEYQGQVLPPLSLDFHQQKVADYHRRIQQLLMEKDVVTQKKALFEYYQDEAEGVAIDNLKDIAREASVGNVKKLIISEDKMIWGKLNRQSGKVRPHPTQLDHEDDDLLDDLAEVVLEKGGEITLTSSELLPQGKLAVALLKSPVPTLHDYYHIK